MPLVRARITLCRHRWRQIKTKKQRGAPSYSSHTEPPAAKSYTSSISTLPGKNGKSPGEPPRVRNRSLLPPTLFVRLHLSGGSSRIQSSLPSGFCGMSSATRLPAGSYDRLGFDTAVLSRVQRRLHRELPAAKTPVHRWERSAAAPAV